MLRSRRLQRVGDTFNFFRSSSLNYAVKRIIDSLVNDFPLREYGQFDPMTMGEYKEYVKSRSDSLGDIFYGGVFSGQDCAEMMVDITKENESISYAEFNWPAEGGNIGELAMVAVKTFLVDKIMMMPEMLDAFNRAADEKYHVDMDADY